MIQLKKYYMYFLHCTRVWQGKVKPKDKIRNMSMAGNVSNSCDTLINNRNPMPSRLLMS